MYHICHDEAGLIAGIENEDILSEQEKGKVYHVCVTGGTPYWKIRSAIPVLKTLREVFAVQSTLLAIETSAAHLGAYSCSGLQAMRMARSRTFGTYFFEVFHSDGILG